MSFKNDQAVFLTPEAELKSGKNYRLHSAIFLFFVLLAIGMANLYSASVGEVYFYAQLKRVFLGFVLFIVVGWLFPLKYVNQYTHIIYAVTCIMLLTVLVLGHTAGGSQRWIHIGPLNIQPSEFAKVVVAMVVAKFFYTHRVHDAFRLRDLWLLILQVGLVFGLIFMQPDLGTAGICLLIAASQIAFIKINFRSLGIVFFSGFVVSAIGWNFLLRDYQKLRILNLLDPTLDPRGSGYNIIQSLVAIGSGQLFGRGYLQGTQSQLQFLPARHTDFIFSVFAEEHGFWAGVLVFLLFGVLTYFVLEIARHASDCFASLLAIGVAALIFIEFAINTAMVLGMFPVVGMPLPFFSYGGNYMLTVFISMGLLVAIDRHTKASKKINEGLHAKPIRTL